MSRLFGPVGQNGYVVRDLDKSMQQWSDCLGIGPWFVARHAPIRYFRFRGCAVDLDLSIALAFTGDLQIELIQQHNDVDSPYLDAKRTGRLGIHHLAMFVDNYDSVLNSLACQGRAPFAEGQLGKTRFAYFDTGCEDNNYVELVDRTALVEIHRVHKNAAQSWDGSEPIRLLGR